MPSPNPYAAEEEKQTQRSLVCSLECVWAELEPWSDLKAEDSATLGPPLCPRSLGCPPPPKGRHGALSPLGKEVPVGWRQRFRGELRDRALWPALGFPLLVKPLTLLGLHSSPIAMGETLSLNSALGRESVAPI